MQFSSTDWRQLQHTLSDFKSKLQFQRRKLPGRIPEWIQLLDSVNCQLNKAKNSNDYSNDNVNNDIDSKQEIFDSNDSNDAITSLNLLRKRMRHTRTAINSSMCNDDKIKIIIMFALESKIELMVRPHSDIDSLFDEVQSHYHVQDVSLCFGGRPILRDTITSIFRAMRIFGLN